MIDVVATQRVVVDLVLDDEVREQWESDPTGLRRGAPATRSKRP